MRGFAVPNRPDDYWECARIVSQGSGTVERNTFLEWILLGPDRNVQLHLLVPTQFGIMVNNARTQEILGVVKKHPDKATVLIKQHDCTVQCVKCGVELKQNEDKPRQVVLRIASGQALHDEWNYDFLLCFFCFDCQTVKTCTLLKTNDTIFNALNACIGRYGFADALPPPTVRLDLMDSYLERFVLLNLHSATLLEEIMQLSKSCYHCGAQVRKLNACEYCGIIYFCKRGECLQKATNNNHQEHLCLALREKHLFHVEESLYVTATGEEVLPCNRYFKI